jgi:hypothetical protein
MVLSVAIHLALLTFADWLLGNETVPAMTSTTLLVTIEPLQATGETAENDNDVQVAETAVAAETIPRHPKPATEATSSNSQTARAHEEPAVETNVATLLEDTRAAPFDVVTTIQSVEPVVIVGASRTNRPVSARAALSPKQKKMLNRELSEWAEDLHRMPDVDSRLTWTHQGQEYLASFTQLPAADDMDIQRVIVEISTEENGKRMSSEVHMKRLAFSNYAQFVNRWDPQVQIHNDEMDGRFHSNSEISLAYDRKVKPLFNGRVTTTSRRINITNSSGITSREQIFAGGLQTGVKLIRLPKHVLPFPGEAGIAADQVHHFSEDTRITFFADGSYAWQAVDSVASQQVANISGGTRYLVADENVVMYVKGTVNGKVLVYSPERIVIEDDLVYEQNPEEVADADDYLGLVSDKYVDIAPPDITGPGDLLINAAIYAKRRFAVQEYRLGESALLYLYGSLSVGTLSATEPRYHTRIQFDQRLEEMRPPGFPMTDRYEVECWDSSWNVEPIE